MLRTSEDEDTLDLEENKYLDLLNQHLKKENEEWISTKNFNYWLFNNNSIKSSYLLNYATSECFLIRFDKEIFKNIINLIIENKTELSKEEILEDKLNEFINEGEKLNILDVNDFKK